MRIFRISWIVFSLGVISSSAFSEEIHGAAHDLEPEQESLVSNGKPTPEVLFIPMDARIAWGLEVKGDIISVFRCDSYRDECTWINWPDAEDAPLGQKLQNNTIPHSINKEQMALLRYGDRTPKPLNFNESALQLGSFSDEIEIFDADNINKVYKGNITFGESDIKVIIKPDEYLNKERVRDNIPLFRDNRRADAAFHLNRFVDLVDTPEHVIRDDAPLIITEDRPRPDKGGAGIQIFSQDSQSPTEETIGRLRSSTDLADELEEIAVFDTLIGNMDRHNNNWLFRESPADEKRSILAIDHTLAFPVNELDSWGNFHMIEWYLESERRGKISPHILRKLDELVANQVQINEILSLNLEQIAIDLMWQRLQRMRTERSVFIP